MKKHLLLVVMLSVITGAEAADRIAKGLEKSATCVACHGPAGISPNPLWPNLAGQHAPYLLKQMQDMKAGKTRNVPVMTAILANLSDEDLTDLAAYYASLPHPIGKTPKAAIAPGERLYRGGNFERHITACIACHGPGGLGNSEAGFPVISGQNAAYTAQQLADFRDKKRANDYNAIMRDISARMTQEDMNAISAYVAGLYQE
ncbi:cytochrome c4 [Legionella geestiana]|uniref:Cytochrome c4 n=1 Tax=Legionella geestiana TaxID=45065 RepID=A0A0W0TP29_9GAMM|nr:c-type cytochrome [Legionella geestiana]KTC97324.1 cytochrome c4 [Legionella geestiana]QBS12448.1 cytochrome c4 [Legionella geestiana]STX55108.1 cytochrome c4 [Legionella geestiana]